jgi:hypothetical protein
LNGKGPEPAIKSGCWYRTIVDKGCGFFLIADPDPVPNPGLRKNVKKFTTEKIEYFFEKKLQFSGPKASIMDAQATGEVLKKPSALKKEHPALQNIYFFLYL